MASPSSTSTSTSALVLEKSLSGFRGQLTVADAATRSGLPLADAEEGLRHLATEFSGHLAASDKGELLYAFPQGLVRPAETRLSHRILRSLQRAALGVARFVVRAWVSVVMVGYAVVFAAILIALALRRDDDDRQGGGLAVLHVVLRVIAEALFWTFHPFSPLLIAGEPGWMHQRRGRSPRVPFYERVNRFVFGPPAPEVDRNEQQRRILSEIRRLKGRVAPADIQRVTGLPREEAERVLLRVMVEHDGDVAVSDDGALIYRFSGLRTTAEPAYGARSRAEVPAPIWQERVPVLPLTGNSAGSNILLGLINGFNLVASSVALAGGWTLERLVAFITRVGARDPDAVLPPLPPVDGIPLVLGAIPFVFSLALFALPLLRLLRRNTAAGRVARENGRRGLLRLLLDGGPAALRATYTADEMERAWQAAVGRPARDNDLRDVARELGGELDLRDDGTIIYRFDGLAREMAALLAARAAASDDEASPGRVVFSSADPGTGIRETPAATPDPDAAATAEAATPESPRLLEGKPETLETPWNAKQGAPVRSRR